MTIETILGIAAPILGGIAEIARCSNTPKVVEKVEVVEPVQQTRTLTPVSNNTQIDNLKPQQPINVNFNLNIYINGKKIGDKLSEVEGTGIIIDA